MPVTRIEPPFEVFSGTDGKPLESGNIYIGTAGLNPETNPIPIYWDAALTIPTTQPVRTVGGYPSRNGSPANIYSDFATHSITVRDKNGKLVYSELAETGAALTSRATVAEMVLFSDAVGSTLNTQGYYTAGDGGGATYLVVAPQAFDGYGDHELANGNIAVLQYSGPANPLQFGAVGDGVTDSLAPCDAAIAVADIKFPDGIFGFSDTFNIPSDRTISGAGRGRTIIVPLPSMPLTTELWKIPSDSSLFNTRVRKNITINSLTFDGANRVYPAYLSDPATGDPIINPAVDKTRNPAFNTKGNILNMVKAKDINIFDIELKNHQSIGIVDAGCLNTTISNSFFHNNGKVDAISSPIWAQSNGTYTQIEGVTNANPAVVTLRDTVAWVTGQDVVIDGVVGMTELNGNAYTVTRLSGTTFQLNGVDSTAYGTFVISPTGHMVQDFFAYTENIKISNCSFYDNERSALTFKPTMGGTVSGCSFENNGESTIFAEASVNVSIENNYFGVNHITDIVANAIEAGAAANITIAGNTFEKTAITSLELQGAYNADVHGNTFKDIVPDGALTYPYGPLAEDWTGTTQGAGDKAGTLLASGSYSVIRIASAGAMPSRKVQVHDNIIDDTRGAATTLDQIINFGKSGTNNIIYDVTIQDNQLCPDQVEGDFTNGKINFGTNNILKEEYYIRRNLGHASNKAIQYDFQIPSVTGLVVYNLGFTPSNIDAILVYNNATSALMSHMKSEFVGGVLTVKGGGTAVDATGYRGYLTTNGTFELVNVAGTTVASGTVLMIVGGFSINWTVVTFRPFLRMTVTP